MSQLQNTFAFIKSELVPNRLVILILLCYPAILLTVRGGMGVMFFLLLLISIGNLYRMRKSLWDKCSIAFAFAMVSPVLAIFLSQAYHGQFSAPYYDWAARFLLAIPIFLALRHTNPRVISVLQYGLPLGALTGLVMLKLQPFDWGGRYTTSQFFNLIHFSDTALMLGFLSLFSINWEHKDHPLLLILKLTGFLAGIYMSVQSGERGGWVAAPFLLLVWFALNIPKGRRLMLGFAILLVIAVSLLSYSVIDVVHNRVGAIFFEVNAYISGHGSIDTSVGIRLQHWHAAIRLFIEQPVFGAGPGGFERSLSEMLSSGMLTPEAARLGHSEVHSEILAKCAETGLFGLVSILSVYFVPLFIFLRTTKSIVYSHRVAGFMGICLVSGFFIFGLTVEIFDLKMTAAFYALTLAVLLGGATNQHNLKKTMS